LITYLTVNFRTVHVVQARVAQVTITLAALATLT
jgi:hypothetical protein